MSTLRVTPRGLLFLVTGALAVVLVAALVVYLFVDKPQASPSNACGPAMVLTPTQECVGIVESADHVAVEFRDVVGKILRHNEEVASSPRYVKIALLTPMSLSKTSSSGMVLEHVQASLEGAYTALHRANTDPGAPFGDPNLIKVQMVLANFGSRQEYSERLINDILGRGEPQHPVVAVVGLGSSLPGTQQTAQALADRGIPMVSAVASADALDSRTYEGLYSVSPSNRDYVLALKALLDKRPANLTFEAGSGLVVADENKTDPFVQGLGKAFLSNLGYYVGKREPQWFTGGTIDAPAPSAVFAPVVERICTAVNEPDASLRVIFYAGRVADFEEFAKRLRGRTCVSKPLAVLSGATGFQVAATYEQTLIDGNVTVIYSTSSDSIAWREGRKDKPEGFERFVAAFRALGFGDGSLDNGYGIMYHDAVASAIRATRVATDATTLPVPGGVRLQFKNITMAGASSTFTFPESNYGRAKGRIVVYRQIGSTHWRLPQDLEPYRTGE
jgi:ABC-type branched-subunit amino acid transport system substrate-binding protein